MGCEEILLDFSFFLCFYRKGQGGDTQLLSDLLQDALVMVQDMPDLALAEDCRSSSNFCDTVALSARSGERERERERLRLRFLKKRKEGRRGEGSRGGGVQDLCVN